ncbi:MAG: YraN family protein [Candidatus Aureabacteria bacterium]|nr:YraN family protein [Candidatus Auribacterota bacterium]MCK5160904.1 YraN family protein [Candidatus Auribacterota bacterium]
MKSGHLRTGSLGESIAKKHLKRKGYDILKQNYKNKYAEIDLIARDKV